MLNWMAPSEFYVSVTPLLTYCGQRETDNSDDAIEFYVKNYILGYGYSLRGCSTSSDRLSTQSVYAICILWDWHLYLSLFRHYDFHGESLIPIILKSIRLRNHSSPNLWKQPDLVTGFFVRPQNDVQDESLAMSLAPRSELIKESLTLGHCPLKWQPPQCWRSPNFKHKYNFHFRYSTALKNLGKNMQF